MLCPMGENRCVCTDTCGEIVFIFHHMSLFMKSYSYSIHRLLAFVYPLESRHPESPQLALRGKTEGSIECKELSSLYFLYFKFMDYANVKCIVAKC